jgi:hypothetical protein
MLGAARPAAPKPGGAGAAGLAALPPSLLTDSLEAKAEAAWQGGQAQWAALPSPSAGLGVLCAEAGRRGMAQPSDADTRGTKPRYPPFSPDRTFLRRRSVLGHSQACRRCSKSKMKCDGARPCSRCMQRGMADECGDQEGVLSRAEQTRVAGAESSQAPVARDIIDTPQAAGSKPRSRQLKHAQACERCAHSKVRCDGGRPCNRCVQRGLSVDCRSRQAARSGGLALVGTGGQGGRTPYREGPGGCLRSNADELAINRPSSAGAAIPQQSAVVDLLSQSSATLARDDNPAAGGVGVQSGAGAAGGGLRLLSLPLAQQHLGNGGNAGHTRAHPWLRGEVRVVQAVALALPRIDTILEPTRQPIWSPLETSQSSLVRTPGSNTNSNLALFSLGNSSSSLGSVSNLFSNFTEVRSTADVPPTLGIPGLSIQHAGPSPLVDSHASW